MMAGSTQQVLDLKNSLDEVVLDYYPNNIFYGNDIPNRGSSAYRGVAFDVISAGSIQGTNSFTASGVSNIGDKDFIYFSGDDGFMLTSYVVVNASGVIGDCIIGNEAPSNGEGNIRIDTTNISFTFDDGSTYQKAHGLTLTANTPTFISVKNVSMASPLLYLTTESGGVVSSSLFAFDFPTYKTITIKDGYRLGLSGTPFVCKRLVLVKNASRVTEQALFDTTKNKTFFQE